MKKILINIIIFFPVFILSQTNNNDEKVVLDISRKPLFSVLEEVTKQTGINFIYRNELIENVNVSGKVNNAAPEKAIGEILDNTDISFKKFGEKYVVLYKQKKPEIKEQYKAELVEKEVPALDTSYSFVRPVMIDTRKPDYPINAVHNKIEGDVLIKLLITKFGDVSNVIVESSSGSEILDSAAIDYVRKLKFMPAIINEKPSHVWLNMKLKYSVED